MSYRSDRNRRVLNDPEPASISGEVVAEYLTRRGMPRMASWARDVHAAAVRMNQRIDELIAENRRLLERLHQYEPPPPRYEPVRTRSIYGE